MWDRAVVTSFADRHDCLSHPVAAGLEGRRPGKDGENGEGGARRKTEPHRPSTLVGEGQDRPLLCNDVVVLGDSDQA